MGGENVPSISGECAIHNFTHLVRGPWVNNGQVVWNEYSYLILWQMGGFSGLCKGIPGCGYLSTFEHKSKYVIKYLNEYVSSNYSCSKCYFTNAYSVPLQSVVYKWYALKTILLFHAPTCSKDSRCSFGRATKCRIRVRKYFIDIRSTWQTSPCVMPYLHACKYHWQ